MTRSHAFSRHVAPIALLFGMLLGAAAQISCAPGGALSGAQASDEQSSATRAPSGADPLADCVTQRNRTVVKLTNEARKDAGLAPVFCTPKLARIAQKHADDMCKQGYFSHTSKDGRTMEDRVDEAKFEFRAIGENIAMGQPTPEEVHAGWMGSRVHRENIERPIFGRLGVGYAACNGQPVWVQNFAD